MAEELTRYERTVYAGVAAFMGGGLVFIVWGAAGRSSDFGVWLALRGAIVGGLIAGILGWFFGEKVLEWLSECLPSRPPGQ